MLNENNKTVILRLKKREVIDLLKACLVIGFNDNFEEDTQHRYLQLHEKIKDIVSEWEDKQWKNL